MKYSLLAVSTENVVNIGDYIQALAARQFLPKVDFYVEREKIHDYSGAPTKMIMNGWYMCHADNWPPSEFITPLYIAVHINSLVKDDLLNPAGVKYLKKHEPIGCRDFYTLQLLRKNNIDAFFSGCLTLTLGYKYKYNGKRKGVYFVEPTGIEKMPNRKKMYWIFNSFRYLSKVKRLNRLIKLEGYSWLEKIASITRFYHIYSKIFEDEIIFSAEYINQMGSYYKNELTTNEERLSYAETLIRKYAKAKLVVTSRIHCALPCTGLETNVLYTQRMNDSETSFCRLDGLLQFFNVISVSEKEADLSKIGYTRGGIVKLDLLPEKNKLWRVYAERLVDTCKKFVTE